MIVTAVAFVAGQLLAVWGSLSWAWCGAVVSVWGAVGCVLARGERSLRCAAAACVGWALASAATAPPTEGCFLPEPAERTKLWLTVEVLEFPRVLPDRTRLVVRAREDRPKGLPLCGRVRLTLGGQELSLLPGDRVRLHARIRRPRNFANPGGYDAVGALARKGIWITGAVTADTVEMRAPTRSGFVRSLDSVRNRIREAVQQTLDPPEAGLARALILGESDAVEPALRERMNRTGTSHLLAISGLHVGVVWGVSHVVLHGLLRRSETLLLLSNVRACAALGALLPTVAYAALAGGSIPTQRALTMACVFVLAVAFGREVATFRTVALAAVLLATWQPGLPAEVGFQLSFVAVLGVVQAVAGKRRNQPVREFVRILFRTAAFAAIATAPLTAFHFNRVSPAGLLVNPFVIPLAAMPGTVLALFGAALVLVSEAAGNLVLQGAGFFLGILRRGVELAAPWPGASFRVPTPSLLETALLYGLLVAWKLGGLHRRRLATVCLVLLAADTAWWASERWLRTDVRIRFLDVGHGDAAVLELPGGRTFVVDGGGFPNSRFDPGEHIVARYLWSRKVLKVDVLVVSHGHWDHQGGLHFLAREFRPEELWRSTDPRDAQRLTELESAVRSAGGRIRVCEPGDVVWIDGDVSARCLYPPADARGSPNDQSLVLLLQAGPSTVLFTGDLEAPAERAFLARTEGDWRTGVSVLKVAHHGSATSSTPAFIATTRPEVAIVSASHGFPDREVLQRYRDVGARLYRTSHDGSVLVRLRPNGRIEEWPYRRVFQPFCSGLGVC